MKFLCRHEQLASHFIYAGLGKALTELKHTFGFWHTDRNSAFDIFNTYQPDVFIGQGYNLDRATIKCINQRPNMQVILKVGAGSKEFRAEYDYDNYMVLMASDKEKELVAQIENKDRLLLFNYCHNTRANYVIGEWADLGYKIWGFLPASDTSTYHGTCIRPPELKSDFMFVGGYWPYKAINFDKYIIPLCYPVGKYNIKIFGNQHWPVPQFLGMLPDHLLTPAIQSATICPNLHEPHSNRYGFDIVPRIFNIIAAGGFCISDYVEDIETKVFTNGELPMFKDQDEFMAIIERFLKNPDERIPYMEKAREVVMRDHTYNNRAKELLEILK